MVWFGAARLDLAYVVQDGYFDVSPTSDNRKVDESVPAQTDLSQTAWWKFKFNGRLKTKPSFKPASRCLDLPSMV